MVNIDIKDVRRYILTENVKWTDHCSFRMFERRIRKEDVQRAILNGEIIEQYPEDYPYPSCLIIGYTLNNKILHVVCGIGNNTLYIITVYCPDIEKWIDDSIRREK